MLCGTKRKKAAYAAHTLCGIPCFGCCQKGAKQAELKKALQILLLTESAIWKLKTSAKYVWERLELSS
jgi:hypothetical protein